MTESNKGRDPLHTAERHLAGYDYRSRFPALRPSGGGEGGTIFTSDGPDGFYIVTDEGTLADFLDEDELRDIPTITIRRFATAHDRDMYCAVRFGRLLELEDM